MPVDLKWHDDAHTILILTFAPGWTWNELYETMKLSDSMIATVDHPVDTILDTRNIGTIPTSALTHLRRLAAASPRPTGLIVLVGAGALVQALLNALNTIMGPEKRTYVYAATLEDAEQLIAKRRAAGRRTPHPSPVDTLPHPPTPSPPLTQRGWRGGANTSV